jgi:hypothetical protein
MLILFIGIQVAFAQTIWNGTADIDWYSDSEIEFTITTAEELAGFAMLVNNGYSFKDKTVKLGRNINLNNTANWKNWTSKPPTRIWTPIGDDRSSFNGTFDGNSYVISGIYINNSDFYQGLFGKIGRGGEIKNLGVTASYISAKSTVGILAGYNFGTISNCYSSGVARAFSTGNLRFESWVGGLVGYNSLGGKISDSYSTGTVSGEELVGGLVGENNNGKIINCYSVGTVTGNEDVGGLVGKNFNDDDISNSYYNKQTSKQSDISKGIGKTTVQMKQKASFEDWDFINTWGIKSTINNGYPYLLDKKSSNNSMQTETNNNSISTETIVNKQAAKVATPTTVKPIAAKCTNGSYKNSSGNIVCRPSNSNTGGATAVCRDGTYSYSQNRRGTCSGHGGVARWL